MFFVPLNTFTHITPIPTPRIERNHNTERKEVKSTYNPDHDESICGSHMESFVQNILFLLAQIL